VPAIVAKTLQVYVDTFDAPIGPVTLVQLVMPLGLVVIVQVPDEVGAAALLGPVTLAVNTTVLANVAVDAFAVTEIVGVTWLTEVVGTAMPVAGE
jgi:hypothetical protein